MHSTSRIRSVRLGRLLIQWQPAYGFGWSRLYRKSGLGWQWSFSCPIIGDFQFTRREK